MFEAGGYQLAEESPAIDSGVLPDHIPDFDLAGNPRIFGAGIDIRAYENQVVTSSQDLIDNHFVTIAPNPASEILNIRIDNDWSGRVELAIYNSQGQRVMQRFS